MNPDAINNLIVIRSLISGIGALGINILFLFRNKRRYKDKKAQNWARNLINLGIFFQFLEDFLKVLKYGFDIRFAEGLIEEDIFSLSLTSFFSGLTIMFGVIFAFYINNIESMLYSPIFYYAGCVIIYFITGTSEYFFYFHIIGALITSIALIEGGIKVKTYLAISIGVYLLFQMIGKLFDETKRPLIDLAGVFASFIVTLIFSKKILEVIRNE